MYDILYFDTDNVGYDEAREKLTTRWSECKVEDASDGIHGYRLGVELPEDKDDEYLKFIVENDWWPLSFCVGMMRYEDPKKLVKLLTDEHDRRNQSKNNGRSVEGTPCQESGGAQDSGREAQKDPAGSHNGSGGGAGCDQREGDARQQSEDARATS